MYNTNNNGMYANYEVESSTSKEFTETETSKKMAMGTGMGYAGSSCMMNQTSMMNAGSLPGMVCPPVYECPQERVIHREIMHEVPHVCPINTRIVNHHIYRHTFSPCYTCCEENEVCNVTDCCCSNF